MNYSLEFLELVKGVTSKRPKTVINHILQNGQITTEDLKDIYGYSHPPRAIRDVRELGIPLETFKVKDRNGKYIAAYRFGDLSEIHNIKLSGRTAFAKDLKSKLLRYYGRKCNISSIELPERDLQIDHRIPFEIAGDTFDNQNLDNYMLLSASSNRLKSWACEHCLNWKLKEIVKCLGCYWAYPENYWHVAMKQIRRLDIEWYGDEVSQFDELVKLAEQRQNLVSEIVKELIRDELKK